MLPTVDVTDLDMIVGMIMNMIVDVIVGLNVKMTLKMHIAYYRSCLRYLDPSILGCAGPRRPVLLPAPEWESRHEQVRRDISSYLLDHVYILTAVNE